jgi:hypothetical protein
VLKKRLCRVCGKKGIKFASDGCLICGAAWVDNTQWNIALGKNQTVDNVLKKILNLFIIKIKDLKINITTLKGKTLKEAA